MTDPWQTAVGEPQQRRRGLSPGAIAAVATGTVVMAVAGLAIGWFAAGDDGTPQANGSPSPTAVVESVAPTASPSELPSPSAAASPSYGGAMVPNVEGIEFREAYKQLRALGLTVNVAFDEAGETTDGNVVRTDPAVGSPLPAKGKAIKLFVAGPVFRFPMPDLAGGSCEHAKNVLLENGLQVKEYIGGKQDPFKEASVAPGTEVSWGDRITLTCEKVVVEPSPDYSPAPAA
ncbi:PASTA domain-containing protein [Catellatospora sp. KI3]|uniref:PASTA domain-containing protein n=1 Tax=Catellatospora sp. KI3 TaxID=3041620 RepID=UPI002482EDAE|nr:PASTA domain-containing protein [Catellatospora sp. KI3]MDI1464182.1 PASTA domain-containing protein [Catellatospora sp. KI3]